MNLFDFSASEYGGYTAVAPQTTWRCCGPDVLRKPRRIVHPNCESFPFAGQATLYNLVVFPVHNPSGYRQVIVYNGFPTVFTLVLETCRSHT